MWRRLFHLLSALSLLMLLVSAAVWVRSSNHDEQVKVDRARWPADDDLRHSWVVARWGAGSIVLVYALLELPPSYFEHHGQVTLERTKTMYPPGVKWKYTGDDITIFFAPVPRGFRADHWQNAQQRRWLLRTPLWLPTALFAVLPTTWLIRRWRRSENPWQFSLRTLAAMTTATCLVLAVMVLLLR